MTHLSRKQIAEIEGLVYLLSRTPREELSGKLSEIISAIKRMIGDFEKNRRHHFQQVRLCLITLLALLDSGHVGVILATPEEQEALDYTLKRLRYFIDNWDQI